MEGGKQGVEAKLRLPAELKGDPSGDKSVEELPHTLAEAIDSYESNQGEDSSCSTCSTNSKCEAKMHEGDYNSQRWVCIVTEIPMKSMCRFGVSS